MSLSVLLADQRRRTAARHGRARIAQQLRHQAAGKPLQLSSREQIERVAAAWVGHDCLADIERLLIARGLQLWVVWKGRFSQVYTCAPDGTGIELLQQADKKKRTLDLTGMRDTDAGQRISAILDQHGCELAAFWRSGQFILQLGSREVSDTHCLCLATCGDGRKSRLMLEGEA